MPVLTVANRKYYMDTSISRSNVRMNTTTIDDFYAYATRDIKAGEQLYYHYGLVYWITYMLLKFELHNTYT